MDTGAILSPHLSPPPLAADETSEPWPSLAAAFFKVRGSGAEPTRQTWVKTAWNSGGWRVLFFAEGESDRLGISFDPVGDGASFFEIAITRSNQIAQAVYRANRSGFKKNIAWQCGGLQSDVKTTPGGWFAEIAIPFEGLGPIRPPAPWKASFWREPAPLTAPLGQRSAWPPGSPLSLHRPAEFGIVSWTGL